MRPTIQPLPVGWRISCADSVISLGVTLIIYICCVCCVCLLCSCVYTLLLFIYMYIYVGFEMGAFEWTCACMESRLASACGKCCRARPNLPASTVAATNDRQPTGPCAAPAAAAPTRSRCARIRRRCRRCRRWSLRWRRSCRSFRCSCTPRPPSISCAPCTTSRPHHPCGRCQCRRCGSPAAPLPRNPAPIGPG